MSAQTDIAADLTRILGAKSDLKTSIEGKGVTVPAATKIDGYAALVDQIQQGGGGGHTGTVDTAGLQALGWDSTDIQWLQDHVWWDAEDDAEWAVSEANKAFGPNGTTPLTWNTRSSIQYNPDVRYLPKLTPSGTNMNGVFSGYYNLVAIPTHGWDMSAVTKYEQSFRNCHNLRSIGDTDYWVTTSTTSLWLMFSSCFHLLDVNMAHWNTSNVTSFGSMFERCMNLTSLDISGLSFAKVTAVQSMFNCCYSLALLKLPSTISAPVLTDVRTMFNCCVSLKSIDVNLTAASVTQANSMVNTCASLKSAKLSISSTVLANIQGLASACQGLNTLDLTGIDTTACAQNGLGGIANQSPLANAVAVATIKLGPNFFKGSFTTLYATQAYSWTRDSIYESLYTNQTGRDTTSPAVTVALAASAYDRLSAQDISDIATKNITLTRG